VRKLRSEERSFRNHLAERDSENLESRGVKDSVSWHLGKIEKFPRLSEHQIHILSKRVRERGDINARNQLALHNLGLVISEARRRFNQTNSTLGFMDLIQEGNIGLLEASEYYDDKKEACFSTYAAYWIKERIQRAIESSYIVRIPRHKHEEWQKITIITNKFKEKFGRNPNLKEISDMIGVSEYKTGQKLFTIGSALLYSNGRLVSLDKEFLSRDGDDDSILTDIIVDKANLEPLQFLIAKEELLKSIKQIKLLVKLIKLCLKDRDKLIFEMRYGLNEDFEVKNLDYISQSFSISRERVRQIVERIWHKLNKIGISQNDDWLCNEIGKVKVLQNLVGQENL
jgi:RNA polymerase primary sigma factor